jgi:hypothetical protein
MGQRISTSARLGGGYERPIEESHDRRIGGVFNVACSIGTASFRLELDG